MGSDRIELAERNETAVAKAAQKRALPKAKPAQATKALSKSPKGKPSAKGKPAKSVKLVQSSSRRNLPQRASGPKPGSMGRLIPAASTAPPNHNENLGPATSNTKPRKNQAGFSPKELEHFRELLLAKRGEIVGDMSSMEREALRNSGGSNLSTLPIHMADMGTDNYEQEFTLTLVETDRKLLREINLALAKIQNGTYGICEGTGKPISKARLDVQPWARYSIEYAKSMERGGR